MEHLGFGKARRRGLWRSVLNLCAWAALGLGAVASATTALAQGPAAPRRLVQVQGDVWRAGAGNWWSFVYVTPDGILLVDPISADFAAWLKGQLAERFPGKPVRYIVYSHSHWDHAGGATAFTDSHPHIVGQERMLRNMDGRWPHMPGDMQDRNNNGTLEDDEIIIPTLQHPGICGGGPGSFESYDRRHTGHVTPADWWAVHDEPKPDLVYSERMTIVLGGRTIQLVFPGLNHADDGTVVLLPAERIAFSADFPADALVTTSMRSLPSACGVFDQHPMAEWIRSFRTIEALDFDTLVQGHGLVTFTKADVAAARGFMEDLRDAVSKGMAEGKSLAELKQSIRLEKYKDWAFYDRLREDNIEAAYLNLKTYR